MSVNDTSEAPPRREGPGARFVSVAGIAASFTGLVVFSITLLYVLVKLWPHNSEPPRPTDDVRQSGDTVTVIDTSTAAAGTKGASPARVVSREAVPIRGGMAALDRDGYLICAPNDTTHNGIPIPTADSARGADCVVLFGAMVPVWIEQRLFVIVLLAGALGATLHALRSLAWYIGNRQLVWSWLGFYLALPLTGSLLAAAFYMIVRGGFFASTEVQATNTFGFAALGVLIGMFTTPAVLKLKEVAETVLTRPSPGADSAPQEDGKGGQASASGVPAISGIERQRRSAGAARDALLIKGTAFNAAATVQVNGQARPAEFQSATAILMPLTEDDAQRIDAGGDFDIVVTNPGGGVSKPFDYA